MLVKQILLPLAFLLLFQPNAKAQTKGEIHQLIQKPGQLITCIADSGSLLNADTIKIFYASEGSKYLEINMFCPNFPKGDSLQRQFMWPASIEFAEEKYFTYKYRRKQKSNSSGDISVIYDASQFYLGEYTLDEKNSAITLYIRQLSWSRSYSYRYNKKSGQLILIHNLY